MKSYSAVCAFLAAASLNLARFALGGLGLVVIYGVMARYLFNSPPPFVEQVALLLVISVAMFGAAAGARDRGHIGLDTVVRNLPAVIRPAVIAIADLLSLVFAMLLLVGSVRMGLSTIDSRIPILGISEAFRYLPLFLAAFLIAMFSIEHLASQAFTRGGR